MNLDECFISLCAISIDENAPKRDTSGVYQICNILNGKRYVGSAQCFRNRWSVHLSTLRANNSHCRYLQAAWNKYGEDAFVFKVIEIVVGDKSKIVAREQFYIDTYSPEYNISKTAVVSGTVWTEERKEKMRKPKSEETKRRMSIGAKRSYELNPDLRQSRIDNFQSVRDSDPTYNRGSRNGNYGKPSFNKDFHSPEMKKKRAIGTQRARDEGRLLPTYKPVEQLSADGSLIRRWPSLIEAAKSVGRTQANISNACRGRIKLTAGFQWRYAA